MKRISIALTFAATVVVSARAVPAPPVLNLPQVTGSTVTLSWSMPFGSTGIRLEAGTAPGFSNAANMVISAINSFTASNVPPGTYYVRVRAVDPSGESAPSNEVTVTVGAVSCAAPPSAPLLNAAVVTGNAVTLSWTAGALGCPPTNFSVIAGSAPGLSNLAIVNTGMAPSLNATAPGGVYFVRVLAQNPYGSAPSNEVVVSIGGGAPTFPPVAPSIGPGQWRVSLNVAPGRYFTDPSPGCYWERQRGFSGSLSDVISNEFIGNDASQWIVDILPSDLGFETDPECGTWGQTPVHGPRPFIVDGVWLVGAQIAPGTYSTLASGGCYWARLRDFTGNLSGIIDNEFISTSTGEMYVTIFASDVGFQLDGCFPLERVQGADPRAREHTGITIADHWRQYAQLKAALSPRALQP